MIVWKPSLAAKRVSPMMVGIRSIPARSSLRHLRSSTDEMPSENSSMLIMASRM